MAPLCWHCQQQEKSVENRPFAITNFTLIDGDSHQPTENAVLIVVDGYIQEAGPASEIKLPENVKTIDMRGKFIIPGLINTHGHVGDVKGVEPGHYGSENIQDQLALYARYGITTVISLGGDREEAEAFRHVNVKDSLHRARLFIAGAVVTGNSAKEVISKVDDNVAMGVDFIKIRVDDNLGTSQKMPTEIYTSIIERSHDHHLDLAAHMFYLADAKSLVKAGADYLAHSVRDQEVDEELIQLLKEKSICYCPTLTRDFSTFVYESTPPFFEDPFFKAEFDSNMVAPLNSPKRQEGLRLSSSAQTYKAALVTAKINIKILSDQNVPIAFGTDSGMPARFPGYFEHLEMAMMAEAGMSPMKIIQSATGTAAKCMGLEKLGVLKTGYHADFVVLNENPLTNIEHSKSIHDVWIAGKSIKPGI